jgi:hypothetical protein
MRALQGEREQDIISIANILPRSVHKEWVIFIKQLCVYSLEASTVYLPGGVRCRENDRARPERCDAHRTRQPAYMLLRRLLRSHFEVAPVKREMIVATIKLSKEGVTR